MRRSAFTLIEVLVVIAIIAILAGILFPVLMSVKESAKQASCASKVSQVGHAMSMYARDYDNAWPLHTNTLDTFHETDTRAGCTVEDWYNTDVPNWAKAIYRYVKNDANYICDVATEWTVDSDRTKKPSTFMYNGWSSGRLLEATEFPARVVLLADAKTKTSWATANPCGFKSSNLIRGISWIVPNNWAPHRNNYNVAFQDGHTAIQNHHKFWLHARYDLNMPPDSNPLPPQNQFYY